MTAAKWIRCTAKHPCEICKKPDWCGFTDDGEMARCMRIQSDKESNGGWLHRLKDAPIRREYIKRVPPPPKPTIDCGAMMSAWRVGLPWNMVEAHAQQLGVSGNALDALGVAYSHVHKAWAFPMMDGSGEVVGVRLRAEDGKKWAVTGSKQGLFYDLSAEPPADHTAYVVEGPTDTAAGLTIGLFTIGRAACLGQADQLRALCRRLDIRRVIVIGDNDEAKRMPDGKLRYPGKEGAEKLIAELKIMSKLIMPPTKDLRQWVQAGATKTAVESLVSDAKWRNK